jgi:hypothetical protein
MSDENPAPEQSDKTSGSSPEIQSPEPINSPKTTQPNTNDEFQEVKRELSGYERSTLKWTRAIVGVNVLTCLFIFLQWHAMRGQLREMKSGSGDTHTLAVEAKAQAEKMSNVSDAANKIQRAAHDMVIQDQRIADNAQSALNASNRQSKASLDATISDFKRDQRAWVGVGQYSIQAFDNKNPFKLVIPFVNSGKTPAVLTERGVNYALVDHFVDGPPPDITYKFDKASAIAPQGIFAVNISNSAVPAAYDAINNGNLFLYFMGEFRYHDIYSPDVHTTDFCLYYDRTAKIMAFCPNGNDMN